MTRARTGGRARMIGSGESHQSASTSGAAFLHKTAERRSRKAPVTPRPYAHTRKPPAKPTETVTGRTAQAIGGGKSRQSSCTSGVATRAKSQKNAAADETRSAPRLIHAPRQAATPARTPPPPQHCWLRRWRSLGGLNPHPGGSKGCAAAASSPPSAQEYITRQSSSKSISLRMTGKMTGKCRTAGNSAKSFQLPASGPGIHTVPSILVGSSLL